jgi:hypothetical protein
MKQISATLSGVEAAINKAYGEGLHVQGERYVVAKIDGGSLYARKVWPAATSHPPPLLPNLVLFLAS